MKIFPTHIQMNKQQTFWLKKQIFQQSKFANGLLTKEFDQTNVSSKYTKIDG